MKFLSAKSARLMILAGTMFCASFSLDASTPARQARQVIGFDFDWRFHLSDVESGEKDIDFSGWELTDVPHDWSIGQEFDEKNPAANAFLPGGIGWYKKEFFWSEDWEDKLVFIDFDGIYMNSTVWLNGHLLGFRPNGYLSLFYELTPYLTKGRNVLTVKVDNSLLPSARWYSGSGIYRHVNIVVTNRIFVTKDGTYVTTPAVSEEKATVKFEVEIENTIHPVQARIRSEITDKAGTRIAGTSVVTRIDTGKNVITGHIEVPDPALWSPEEPNLYELHTFIECDGRQYDEYVTTFGIRSIEFDPESGFRLNGRNIKMKGVCMHQNSGPFGSAIPDDTWVKRLKMLKEMGCNAIRTSHYPYSPVFYRLCDEMGFMVMDEPWDGWLQWHRNGKAKYDYSYYFLDWWQQDLAEFIRRDRNHPCVVMWCMGNEVWRYEKHMYVQKLINDTFHRLDPTRPTTQAWSTGDYLDIAGFNANGEGRYDLAEFHRTHPGMLAVGTEIPHTRQTRGVYRTKTSYMPWDKPDNSGQPTAMNDINAVFPLPDLTEEEVFEGVDPRYASSYDNQTRKISCRDQWRQTRDNWFFIGEFRWTAFDYLGESWGWPARTNNYGIIDMADFPKDHYWLYQSFWTEEPMIHLLPHWTHPGREGISIPVVVYTNCDEAELFLNGKSLGRKAMDKDTLQIVWKVPYEPGKLTAAAYRDGKEAARKSIVTASEPYGIKMTLNRTEASANRRDVIYAEIDITDRKGNPVPDAGNRIDFTVTGPYKLLGLENGDILDQTPAKSTSGQVFKGKTLLVLQTTDKTGTISVTAESEGLESARQTIKVH